MIDDQARAFFSYLHREGRWSYWWDGKTKLSNWWPVAKMADLPLGEVNLYFGVHPTASRKSNNQRATNEDIVVVNCLFAEFDAKDFGGSKEAASTHIRQLPIAPSVIIDSGGGYHCYWLLTDPFLLTTPEERDRARRAQASWVKLVGGDQGAKDLARVLRVPGTRNFKPEYAPVYPTVEFIKANLDLVYVFAVLERLVQSQELKVARQSQVTDKTSRYGQSALEGECDRVAASSEGYRNTQLNRSAFAIGQLILGGEVDRSSAERSLFEAACRCGLDSDPACGESGVRATIQSGIEAGMRQPRTRRNSRHSGRSLRRPASEEDPPSFVDVADGETAVASLSSNEADHPCLLTESADDAGNAQCVYQLRGHELLYCDAYGWLHWTGTHWSRDVGETHVRHVITEVLKLRRLAAVQTTHESIVRCSSQSARHIKDAEFLLRGLVTVRVDAFDAAPEQLNCLSGVIDLRTRRVHPHTPSQRFTYCLPVRYSPEAKSEEWDRFLAGAIGGGSEVLDYVQRAVGYSLTGETREECLFYLQGPPRSGKGTFQETLLELLPPPFAIQADFNTFTAKRDGDANNFDLAPLKPARLVFASESNREQRLNPGKIKQLTGGDHVRCAFKYKTHFSYRPQYKIWLISNHPARGDVDDDALWNRIRVIEFPNSMAGKEDKLLKQRLKKPANLEAVLAWAVQGAYLWYSSPNGLVTPLAVCSATQKHRGEQDYVQHWLDERTEKLEAWTPNPVVYESYRLWCQKNGVTPECQSGLSASLKAKGYRIGVLKKYNGKSTRGVDGILIIEAPTH